MPVSNLPIELVRDICSYLKLHDWCAFRATCQDVYSKSLGLFADRYFKIIGFMLTRNSLCQLEELAAHNIFRTRVQELWVTPSLFEGYYEMDLDAFRDTVYSSNSRQSDDTIKAAYIAYQGLVAEHLTIVESDALSNVLKNCVARFENLTTIRLQHNKTDEFSFIRRRNDNFRCIGWRAARRQLGFDPFSLGGRRPIHNLLKTIAKDHAVAFSALLEAVSLLSSLGQLEFLHLCTSSFEPQPDDSAFRSVIDIPLLVAPSLKVLIFSQWDMNGALDPQCFNDLSQRINFSNIEEIHLYWTEITLDSFKAFLRTAKPTLRTLSLESVNLRGTSSPTNNHTGHERDLRDCP